MTTLSNGNRKISMEFGSLSTETKKIVSEEKIYTIKLPTITCSNEDDAKTIQIAVDKYVSDLVKDVLAKEN